MRKQAKQILVCCVLGFLSFVFAIGTTLFTKSAKAEFIAQANLQDSYSIGQTIEIPTAVYKIGDAEYKAYSVVYTPNGVGYKTNKISLEKGFTKDCSVMAYGFNPEISKKSPYHGAYLAVVESVSKLIASGADFTDVYLTFQEYFAKPQKSPTRWGQPATSLLGAFKAQMELGIGSIGGKDSMSGTFNDIDVPPTLVSFAVDIAKYGDIVYWASNGKYRMPTGEEMQKLYTDACRTKASYTTAEGVEVLGTYYYDPAAGETPGAIEADTPRVLKNADMKKGLFLPYTGRFYSTGLTKLYGINAQGVYRSSTTISASTLEQTYGAIYRPHTLAEKDGKYPSDFIYTYWEAKNQGAYGAISLYSIRPVKVK